MSDRDPTDVWRTAPVPTLSESMNIAKHLERERIIKLLEQASLDFEQHDFNAVGVTNGLIALIKGEK